MEQYNARFAKAAFDDRDVHRALIAGHDDLDETFAWKEERTVSINLTLQYDQVLFILEPSGIARSLARKRVTVIDYPNGRLAIRYNGIDLPYRTFDKRPQVNQAAIVENKRLGPILAYIATKEAGYVPIRQGAAAPGAEEPHVQGRLDEHPGRRVARLRGFTRRPIKTQNSTSNEERTANLPSTE